MESGYIGLDLSQLIFAIAVIMVFIGFVIWGLRTHSRIRKVEEMLRDFRELEPEGYEEEETLDTVSEVARIQADGDAARQRDILEHSR